MDDELDFSAEEFQKMSRRQRIRFCRLLSERARKLGALSSTRERGSYLRIAEEWDNLATELERLD